jgi:DNA modification methylase
LTNGHISHIHGSNISLDDLGVHPLEQNFYHIVNKSSLPVPPNCICSHYQIKTDKSSHFATFPPKLITPCVLAGCPVDGVVLDPFMGSGTVGMVCRKHGRKFVGIELNPSYIEIAKKRIIGGY